MSFFSSARKSELNSTKHQVHEASADVLKEFKSFLTDVDDLFQSTTSLTGEDLAKARSQLKQRIKSAKQTVGEAGGSVFKQAQKTAAITNNYVHEKPWTIIGAGVALSFLVGLALSRRD